MASHFPTPAASVLAGLTAKTRAALEAGSRIVSLAEGDALLEFGDDVTGRTFEDIVRAFVYRDGILIGATAVSTGRPGFATPTGVENIGECEFNSWSAAASTCLPSEQTLELDAAPS